MHRHPFDLVFFNPGIKRGPGEAHDTQRRVLHARPPGFFTNGQPDFKRCLCRNVVKTQGGQQTDHTLGCTFANFGQRVVLGDATVGEDIEPAGYPLQLAGCTETTEVGPGDVVRIQVSRTQDSGFPDQFQHFVCFCG